MMKGDDKYVTKMTHFPKPPPKVIKKPPVQQMQELNMERRPSAGIGLSGLSNQKPRNVIQTNQKPKEVKPKKRIPEYEDGISEAKVRKKSNDEHNPIEGTLQYDVYNMLQRGALEFFSPL